MPKITPNLWFDLEAEEAASFYVSVFPNSRIVYITHYTEASRRGELHPPALSEPDVTVSRHPAPIIRRAGVAAVGQ